MKSIKEKAEEYAKMKHTNKNLIYIVSWDFAEGANYVLDVIEKELQRRMLEDYNQGAEEDEVAQGCMATMIMFVRQLKK